MTTPWDDDKQLETSKIKPEGNVEIKNYPVIANDIWNAAIEEAAKIADRSETNITKLIAEDIRGLKK